MSRRKRESTNISARLYHDDPTEARALAVLEKWRKGSGLTTNEIITRALLALDEQPIPEKPDRLAARLSGMIDRLEGMMGRVGQGGLSSSAPQSEHSAPGIELDSAFIANMRNQANKGQHIEGE